MNFTALLFVALLSIVLAFATGHDVSGGRSGGYVNEGSDFYEDRSGYGKDYEVHDRNNALEEEGRFGNLRSGGTELDERTTPRAKMNNDRHSGHQMNNDRHNGHQEHLRHSKGRDHDGDLVESKVGDSGHQDLHHSRGRLHDDGDLVESRVGDSGNQDLVSVSTVIVAPSVPVYGDWDHKGTGADDTGKYFLFIPSDWQAVFGPLPAKGAAGYYNVDQRRNGKVIWQGQVAIWILNGSKPEYGIPDGFEAGRRNPKDITDNGQWQTGDIIVPLTPTPAPTTAEPSLAPTILTRANKVEAILAEYSPLNQQTLDWLIFEDTWEPDAEDPNHDYLWLERYAMAALYDSTNGPSWWYSNKNWKTSEPVCNWNVGYGDNTCPGPITNVNLYSSNLQGSLPPVFGNLGKLTWLNLDYNQLTGSIPSSIGNLSQLTYLSLFSNQLTGSIPSSIGNLGKLTWLSLVINQLTGSIPPSIGNLGKLTLLSLAGNRLTGSIPSSIGNLSELTSLGLSQNQLTGSIPSFIGNLSKLTGLFLHDNQLTGSIPSLPSSIISSHCYLYDNCFQNLENGEAAGCRVTPNCS